MVTHFQNLAKSNLISILDILPILLKSLPFIYHLWINDESNKNLFPIRKSFLKKSFIPHFWTSQILFQLFLDLSMRKDKSHISGLSYNHKRNLPFLKQNFKFQKSFYALSKNYFFKKTSSNSSPRQSNCSLMSHRHTW